MSVLTPEHVDRIDSGGSLIERVRSVAPTIRASAEALEIERRFPEELVDALYDAGIFNALLADDVGGLEPDPVEWLVMVEELARLNASVGWIAMIQSGIGLRFLDAERFHRFAERTGGRLILSMNLGRAGGFAVKVDGGYVVNGRWPFTSGSPYATWLGGASVVGGPDGAPVLGPDGQPQLLVAMWPASEATLIDTWDGLGLRGTGSGDFAVQDLFVPDEQVSTEFAEEPDLHGLYGGIHELPEMGHGAHALGVASAVLDEFVRVVGSKPVRGSMRQAAMGNSQVHRIDFGKADALVRAGRSLMHGTVAEAADLARRNEEVPLELKVRLREANLFTVRAAKEAVDLVFAMAGSGAVFRGRVIEQAFRDISTAANHINTAETVYSGIGSYFLTRDREGGPEIDGRPFA